jgi:3D (Asp-Asp-Asp) domain-containing protein
MSRAKQHAISGILMLAVSACSHRIQPAMPPVAPPAPFTATAYCAGGVTASGVPVARGMVAADPAVLPLGTVIRINGAESYDGTYRVLDTGSLVRSRRVDVYIPDCAEARRFGRRSVRVTVLRGPR